MPPPSLAGAEDAAPPLAEATRIEEPLPLSPGEGQQQEHQDVILRQQMLRRQLLSIKPAKPKQKNPFSAVIREVFPLAGFPTQVI